MKMDAIAMLGKKLKEDMPRDAVHIAVMQVIIGENLFPGQRIKFQSFARNVVVSASVNDSVGVIDPFVVGPLNAGDSVWMFVNPRTVTGMRHEWQCPAIDDVPY